MNLRDKRPIGDQVRSGFRLAGWILLTFAISGLMLGSIASLLGKGYYTKPVHRILAACVLSAISFLLFRTVRHWVQWFIGALGYLVLKCAVSVLLGFTPSVPSITRPRLVILEYLVVAVFAMMVCIRYLSHAPRTAEKVGLVGLVIALGFSMTTDANLPMLAAITTLGLIQLVADRRGARRLHKLACRSQMRREDSWR